MPMLLRQDPFADIERLADDLFRGRVSETVPLDAVVRDGGVVVSLDLPGVDPDSIDVTLERNALTIRAERPAAVQEGDKVLIHERRSGTVARRIYLSDHLDDSEITADYRHGVLTMRIPVSSAAKPRRISVTARDELAASTVDDPGDAA